MKTKREEKLSKDVQYLREELHRTKQKVRDIEKGRESYKRKLKEKEEVIDHLEEEVKKKRLLCSFTASHRTS